MTTTVWVPEDEGIAEEFLILLNVETGGKEPTEFMLLESIRGKIAHALEGRTLGDLENELSPMGIDAMRLWISHPHYDAMATQIIDLYGASVFTSGALPMRVATKEEVEQIRDNDDEPISIGITLAAWIN